MNKKWTRNIYYLFYSKSWRERHLASRSLSSLFFAGFSALFTSFILPELTKTLRNWGSRESGSNSTTYQKVTTLQSGLEATLEHLCFSQRQRKRIILSPRKELFYV